MTSSRRPALRLHIDWTRCDGRGLCTELLPSVLDRDDWGYPLPRNHTPEPGIPAQLQPDARDAVRLCPRLALTLLHPND
ncbi:ferredoxin [Rhodococcus sp. NPDC056960]|jgi:ferredoxin|uniref:ferredoxin n=1 Tax=Rhodococcus sp. NPDC056960 TaxID=3345982 RepID=UPI0036306598